MSEDDNLIWSIHSCHNLSEYSKKTLLCNKRNVSNLILRHPFWSQPIATCIIRPRKLAGDARKAAQNVFLLLDDEGGNEREPWIEITLLNQNLDQKTKYSMSKVDERYNLFQIFEVQQILSILNTGRFLCVI